MRHILLLLCAMALTTANLPYCGIAPGQVKDLPPAPANAELRLVQVLMRHGDRSPASQGQCWPNDEMVYECGLNHFDAPSLTNENLVQPGRLFRLSPMKNRQTRKGNCMAGQLTTEGYEQLRAQGQAFAKAYVGTLLSKSLRADEVWIRADNSARVQMSAQAMLEGLYPTTRSTGGVPVVDLHTMDEDLDDINPSGYVCPKMTELWTDFYNSEWTKNFTANVVAPLIADLSKDIGIEPTQSAFQMAVDCYWVHACHNEKTPGHDDLWARATDAAYQFQAHLYAYPNRTIGGRYSMGPLLGQMVQNMLVMVGGGGGPKFRDFHGHDTSVMPFLSMFGLLEEWCPYAGYVALELYNVGGDDHAVRMVVHGEARKIAGCSDVLCPLPEFLEVTKSLIPNTSECHMPWATQD